MRRTPRAVDPERPFLAAVRLAIVPTLCLPAACASLGASTTGEGLPLLLALPLAALSVMVCFACWVRMLVLWRALPKRGDDDDSGWRRWWDAEAPRDPSGGPSGIRFDWASFERQFWSHVKDLELQRRRELVPV